MRGTGVNDPTDPDDRYGREVSDDLNIRRQDLGQVFLTRASRLPGRSLHLAVALQLIATAQSSYRVPLSNVATQVFGLNRNAKYRALAWLERAGLVQVERKIGRSPLVTILYPGTGDVGRTQRV